MSRFDSNIIKIYPAANRSEASGRLNIEQNIVNIVNRLTDTSSFIINGLNIKVVDKKYVLSAGECNINGYFVKILEPVILTETVSNNKVICLDLYVENKLIDTNYTVQQCSGTDSADNTPKYSGVVVSLKDYSSDNDYKSGPDNESSPTYYRLPICHYKTDSTKKLNDSIKFNINKTFINNITKNTGLTQVNTTDITNNNTFEDWLKNDFIIDDGEIK